MTDQRLSPVWHPFMQHALRPHLPIVTHAEGAYLTTGDGRRVLDAISSWWVSTHGHRHPRIVAAVKAQLETLDQVIFAEFTHRAAETVAERLISLTAPGLAHVFFSDSGSTSVEVALKMALVYWHNIGEPRRRIVVMEHSYHGDTVGTMSVGARSVITAAYEPLLFDVAQVPFPAIGREEATFTALDALCRAGDIAAFIVEPLVLGAGGMLMYSAAVLAEMARICASRGVLFIADEVMTGWGRTGSMFACQQAGVTPDIACYSKGLTGGLLPLAATLCRPEIFAAHWSTDRRRTFFHSSSYTANPLACAAAAENIAMWEDEPVLARFADLAVLQARQLDRFREDRRFANVRQTGTITAMDIAVPDDGYLAAVGPPLHASFQAAHILLRPLGNTVYVMPPYCVTAEDLAAIYEAIGAAADLVCR